MFFRSGWWPSILVLALAVACAPEPAPQLEAPSTLPLTPSASASPTASPAPATPEPAAPPIPLDVRAMRLAIPSLGIDSPVQASYVIPDTSPAAPGCPTLPDGRETLTVPDEGIATPEASLEGLENRVWLFGHSRWLSQRGVFFSLQDLNVGDELFIDGVERRTGAEVTRQRFVVDALYLTDTDSGGKLVIAQTPSEIPATPVVFLQTSVREDGANRQWILDRQKLLAKSRNLIEGDTDDPCKYLLLFVRAQAS